MPPTGSGWSTSSCVWGRKAAYQHLGAAFRVVVLALDGRQHVGARQGKAALDKEMRRLGREHEQGVDVLVAGALLDVVQQLHGMLGNDDVMAIRSKAATGDLTQAVSEWLSANPLT